MSEIDNQNDEHNFTITNEINNNNSEIVVHTTFITNDLSNNVIINEDFKQMIKILY